MRMWVLAAALSMSTAMFPLGPPCLAEEPNRYFVITVVDDETGRGVPLVELQTTNAISYFTDSRGDVDALLAKAKAAGAGAVTPAEDDEGSYSGYFTDPDGHIWEVLYDAV